MLPADMNGKQLQQALKQLGVSLNEAEAATVVRVMDRNNDGSLSYVEFDKTLQQRQAAAGGRRQ